jgi:hypothetical protein
MIKSYTKVPSRGAIYIFYCEDILKEVEYIEKPIQEKPPVGMALGTGTTQYLEETPEEANINLFLKKAGAQQNWKLERYYKVTIEEVNPCKNKSDIIFSRARYEDSY